MPVSVRNVRSQTVQKWESGTNLLWQSGPLNFREEIKEGIDTLPQLRFDLLARSFENVHGDAR